MPTPVAIIAPWNITSEELPSPQIEIIGFHKEWIDEDFNPDGQRICFLYDEVDELGNHIWMSAAWCGYHDEWHTVITDEVNEEGELTNKNKNVGPSHWMPKPTSPK